MRAWCLRAVGLCVLLLSALGAGLIDLIRSHRFGRCGKEDPSRIEQLPAIPCLDQPQTRIGRIDRTSDWAHRP
jgi:hypothetical protein